jgi:hypothetical protein
VTFVLKVDGDVGEETKAPVLEIVEDYGVLGTGTRLGVSRNINGSESDGMRGKQSRKNGESTYPPRWNSFSFSGNSTPLMSLLMLAAFVLLIWSRFRPLTCL